MDPLRLYQERLDRVSHAVLAGDFAAYLDCIALPYVVRTKAAHFTLVSPAELKTTFDTLSASLAARDVTHYERVARAAEYLQVDRIAGSHHTHMIAHGTRVIAPHLSRQILVRRGGVWLFAAADYPFDTDQWPLTPTAIFGATEPSPHNTGAASHV
jgi:hypothetical protein